MGSARSKLEAQLAWLDELLVMSRAQRRRRGIKAGKLQIVRERHIVAEALRVESTAVFPVGNDDPDSTAGTQ